MGRLLDRSRFRCAGLALRSLAEGTSLKTSYFYTKYLAGIIIWTSIHYFNPIFTNTHIININKVCLQYYLIMEHECIIYYPHGAVHYAGSVMQSTTLLSFKRYTMTKN